MSLLQDMEHIDQSVSSDTQHLIREGHEFEVLSNDPESMPGLALWELPYMTTRMDVLVRAAHEQRSARLSHKDMWG
ncbi:hypothetical protein CSOJ01_09919 [Colletotrichum sojae]|uniref:Uncharacterized protein n=1 Tax=Colletotrichum sojae TaxID=2175907 RepID=A0A8H6J297_9PEZI|nr:hypothetical protein CSOJ01_09919 [Colletotrichum sojae]